MIICPECNHNNPEGAEKCEACFAPLPSMATCPNCHEPVQTDAAFCGNCGQSLRQVPTPETAPGVSKTVFGDHEEITPEVSEPIPAPEPLIPEVSEPIPAPEPLIPEVSEPTPEIPKTPPSGPPAKTVATQLQIPSATLKHVQTSQNIELPADLKVIHIGRPNDQIPPDIDVSPFPDADVVSRVHADIRLEDDGYYYLEDMGSANGTYVNGQRLLQGNRHRLREGDRFALGKQDKVSFIFSLPQ